MLPETLALHPVVGPLSLQLTDAILEASGTGDEITLVLKPDALLPVGHALKTSFGFERVSSVTAVDWWPRDPRFEVVYHLHSIQNNARLRLKLRVDADTPVDSLTPVWRGANWYEREVFDLFGIQFRNHPNLERIMMPADWEGHPLRKDFPVHGFKYSYQDQ